MKRSAAIAQVLRFPLPAKMLQSETTALICQAFDKVCRALHDRGQPDSVREVIAKRVIEIAGRGERDPDKMCEAALTSLGLVPKR